MSRRRSRPLLHHQSADYEISGLREADADGLGPLHNRLWRETYAGLIPAAVLDDRDDGERIRTWRDRGRAHEEHGRSPEGGTTFVARDDQGTPVGWITAGPPRDEEAPAPIELWALYVAPEHHGDGLGRLLLDSLLPDGPAYLWVLQGNHRAIAFYRRAGFAEDGATKELEGTGALELRMTR